MPSLGVSVDTICTEKDLADFLGEKILEDLLDYATDESSKNVREYAFRRIMEALRRRTPPIFYSDLQDPTELMDAVMYGASERLYQMAITNGNTSEVFVFQYKEYSQKFEDELDGLSPTLAGGVRGSTSGVRLARA